jgi:hypothetical protein
MGDPTQRPCQLPSIQIDTWGVLHRPTACTNDTLQCLAKEVCADTELLLLSLLQCTRAVTVAELVESVGVMNGPLQAVVRGGQVYMHDTWRVRYRDMSERIQALVRQVPDGTCVNKHFILHYTPKTVHNLLLTLAGPARSAGMQALLPAPRAPADPDRRSRPLPRRPPSPV